VSNPYLTGPVPFRQISFAVLETLLLLLLAVTFFRSIRSRQWRGAFSSPSRRLLILFFVVSYVAWAYTSGIYRYAIVLEILAYPAIIVTIFEISRLVGRMFITSLVALIVVVTILATQQIPDWGRAPSSSSFFHVAVPAMLRDARADIVIVDDAPNGYVVTALPTRDVVVHESVDFPLVGPMLATARADLPADIPTYAIWGDPSELGETAYQVNVDLSEQLAQLGYVLPATSFCITFTANYQDSPYPLRACRLTPVDLSRSS
jgi:hypothetical protein